MNFQTYPSCTSPETADDFWQFVEKYRDADIITLRLKFHTSEEAWLDDAITHIECLQRCKKKFGDLQPKLMLSTLSLEQATSCQVALLHAAIAQRIIEKPQRMLDMTCGMGIDLMAVSDALGCHAIGIELDRKLSEVTAYNFIGRHNVEIVCADSVKWLHNYNDEIFDLIFIDPARRGNAGQRLFNIHDCHPDISMLIPQFALKSRFVMAKLSPMLDITQTLRDLPKTIELHVVDEGGECRELLAVLDMSITEKPDAAKIIIHSGNTELSFTQEEEKIRTYSFGGGKAGMWLFEPSPAAMKAAPFASLCTLHHLIKLHPNTHLFYGPTPIPGLPGKWYEITGIADFSSSTLKALGKKIGSADVAVRNFPLRAEELQKRLKVKSGGLCRVIGATVLTSDNSEKRMLFVLNKGV